MPLLVWFVDLNTRLVLYGDLGSPVGLAGRMNGLRRSGSRGKVTCEGCVLVTVMRRSGASSEPREALPAL